MAQDDLDGDEDDEGSGRESSRERSARMRAFSAMALVLVNMGASELVHVPLSPELAEAVRDGQRFTKNARARQLRRIAGLLRMTDTAPITDALRELETGRGARSKREQAYERWRTSLLGGGDPAMTAFVAAHPHADVQALRQLVRNASRDPASPRGKAAARDLLRMVRALGESATPVAATPDDADDADAPDGDDVSPR